MGSTEAIPCCCQKKQYLCCLDVTATYPCSKAVPDNENCTVNTGGQPEFRTLKARIQACAATEEECQALQADPQIWCKDQGQGMGCGGGVGDGQIIIDSKTATFYPGVECTGPEADAKCSSSKDSIPCLKMSCGPCGPYFDGCADADSNGNCPPVPDCPQQPCCGQNPSLCCFTTITNGCISSQYCGPCGDSKTSGDANSGEVVTKIQDCSSCKSDVIEPKVISTACCSSCALNGSYEDPYCVEAGLVCCYTCSTEVPCIYNKCVYPCGQPQDPRPLCPCPLAGSSSGPCGTLFEFNSAENRYTSGFVKTNSGAYQLDTLFLFGYGYNQL